MSRSRRVLSVIVVIVTCAVGQPLVSQAGKPVPLRADRYDDVVQQAETLWKEGRKAEAVRAFGHNWKLRPEDVDRQILYGYRSAEVGNYRWAINYFAVAEQKVLNDPARLCQIYEGYARTWRDAGRPDRALPYEEKAKALRDASEAAVEPPKRPGAEGGTETKPLRNVEKPAVAEPKPAVEGQSPPPGVTVVKTPQPFLKKRIAVAPIRLAVAGEGLAGYAMQIEAMLVGELQKTERFATLDRKDIEAILKEQTPTGGAAKSHRLPGAHLVVEAEMTDFDSQSGPDRTSIRAAMIVHVYNAETGVVLTSGSVADERVTAMQEAAVPVSAFRWDEEPSKSSALGFVTRELVEQVLAKIVQNADRVRWSATVMQVSGEDVYFNAGKNGGVRAGDRFRIVSVDESPVAPDAVTAAAGEKEIAEIEVTTVDEKYSIGILRRKTGEVRRHDKVVEKRGTRNAERGTMNAER